MRKMESKILGRAKTNLQIRKISDGPPKRSESPRTHHQHMHRSSNACQTAVNTCGRKQRFGRDICAMIPSIDGPMRFSTSLPRDFASRSEREGGQSYLSRGLLCVACCTWTLLRTLSPCSRSLLVISEATRSSPKGIIGDIAENSTRPHPKKQIVGT